MLRLASLLKTIWPSVLSSGFSLEMFVRFKFPLHSGLVAEFLDTVRQGRYLVSINSHVRLRSLMFSWICMVDQRRVHMVSLVVE